MNGNSDGGPAPRHDVSRPLSLAFELVVEEGASAAIAEDEVARITQGVLRREGAAGAWTIVVVLTTDDRLRRLHADFMGIDEETDVMTFPSGPFDGESVSGGDIVISTERASDQADDYGHSTHEEIRFLIVHGLLHLCGWTDETPETRAAMLAHQEVLIAEVDGLATA